MGFLKKKNEADLDSSKSALFGNRKGKATPPSANPYAQQDAPPAYSGGNDSFRQEKTPSVTGPGQRYGGGGGGGYGAQGGYGGGGGSYGGGAGYGGDRYGGGGQAPPRRQGGYGGLGGADPNNEEDRGALFGGAADRYQQRQPQQPQPGGYGQQGSGYGQSGVSGAYGSGGYGNGPSYDDRQLTAEEQEEEDISATKNEIKFMKQQDVSSTRNALRLAQQAEETGRDTLARLGAQGERIHNTEKNLDLASSQNRIAEEKTRELKTVNRSMFAVHVANPFTSNSRREERDRKIMENHRNDRDARDATRKAAWESGARQDDFNKGMASMGPSGQRSTLADRAKYQFEADSDDDAMENEIDDNLDQLHGAAKRLNALGRAMGSEVDQQNKHIDRITQKTDKVDDQIAMNRSRLDRIH